MPLIIPNVFVGGPGHKAKASEVNANFVVVAGKFNAAIGTADLANDAVTSDKIVNNAVTSDKIAGEAVTDSKLNFDPANPGVDAGRAVSGDHIKSLTSASLARILPASGIARDKLGIIVDVNTPAFSFAPSVGWTGTALTIVTPRAKADYDLIGVYTKNVTYPGHSQIHSYQADDSGANWALTLLVYADGGGTFSGTPVIVYAKKVTS